MQITLTPEQQAALNRGESITIDPPKSEWSFKAPITNNYCVLTVGHNTSSDQDHKVNNVFKLGRTVAELEHKLRFMLMCARFREHFEPGWESYPCLEGVNWNYYVYFSHWSKTYCFDSVSCTDYKSVVYMSKECAKTLTKLLNNNQVPGFEL